nr:FKBP-type peptidyl-prolyl cis-trans isomerase [Vibrio sp. Of7-15]
MIPVSKFIFPLIIAVLAFFLIRTTLNNKKVGEENIRLGTEFLAQNLEKEGVQVTKSGLQYKVLTPGTGTSHPTATTKVKVHYHGTLIDGTVFDSSVERGQPIEFKLNQVIKGWQEGLQLMVEGEKTRFFIPSDLAYGNSSTGAITPRSVLIFDVELISF